MLGWYTTLPLPLGYPATSFAMAGTGFEPVLDVGPSV